MFLSRLVCLDKEKKLRQLSPLYSALSSKLDIILFHSYIKEYAESYAESVLSVNKVKHA